MVNELLYPVHIYQDGMDLPKEGTYFLVAGNGTWLHKDTGIVRCFVPVGQISFLNDLDASVELECKLPMVPARLVWRIKQFFKKVVEAYHSEAEVNLYYSKGKNDYKVHIPKQTVSHGGVRYARVAMSHLENMSDYLRVGTIHSHCDFGAFHSGTDEGDEIDFDGLHVTFGHNDKDQFTISASIVVNGHRMKIEPQQVLDGIVRIGCDDNKTGFYRLRDNDADQEFHEWADGLDQWMEQVSPASNGWGGNGMWGLRQLEPDWKKKEISKGSKITWAGSMHTSAAGLKKAMGDGPFDVLTVEGDKVVIQTKVGAARLSHKLFKAVQT